MAKQSQTKSKDSKIKSPDREQRWDEIIHEAAAIFYEKGYEATSLQDIATAVGLLKGSIYYYIKTKEDLLFELVVRAQTIWMETLVETEELAGGDAPTRMREFILRFMRLKEREREWGIVAEREFMRLSPDYLSQVIAGRKRFSDYVEGIIEQGVADGDFDASLDVTLASAMVFELMKSSHTYRRPRGQLGLLELADSYSLFTMRGLGASSWTPPAG
ncbi:MAG: TetR/AcrR family transcriptional regulator [Actinomycetota bacterium]|nr:TetR/AcrR family transcriptional regulator [Actinomycetota bacterium]